MIEFTTKIWYITRGSHRSLVATIFLFIFISFLEVFSTGIVGPFVAIAIEPSLVKNNYWLKLIYERLNFSSDLKFLFALGTVIVALFFVKAFLSFNAQKLVFKFSNGIKASLAYKLLKAYIEAPYIYHLRINSANLIQNITHTTDAVSIGLISTVLTFISNSIIVLALMFLLVKTNVIALAFIAVLLLVSFGLIYPMKARLSRWSKEGYKAYGEMIRIVNHGLGGLKETRIIGCESYFDRQMKEETEIFANSNYLASAYGNLPRFVLEPLMISFLIGFTFLFAILNQGDIQSLAGVLSIFALALVRLLPAIGNSIYGVNIIRSNLYCLDKLFFELKELADENILTEVDFTNTDNRVLPSANSNILTFSSQVILDKLSFHYPGDENNVLEDISLTIKKGESIGIIGKSGAGKTTLADILLGLFTPQSGDIKVDGISVYSNLRAWQNLLGYVPQSIFLIDDTIARNIAFGVPDRSIDRAKLDRAIEMAQLSEVIERLPNGIDTIVGERGVLLSGGQRQRVGIARVLYHEREIIVFDEATAALDSETENLVTEATTALSGRKTIIIIAHRLSTLAHCDRIYQLDRGKIVRSGSYQEVVLESQK